jgi:hypothetical protein
MKRGEFVEEGSMEVGPTEHFFLFLEGEHLGKLLLRHFRLPEERGDTNLGRVRITVERLEDDAATEEASPTK